MSETSTRPDLNEAFCGLLEKYGVQPPGPWRIGDGRFISEVGDGPTLVPGWALAETELPIGVVPLLPWRHERRFQELKRLVENGTVETVVMGRFSCVTCDATMGLSAILYREFALLEWLLGSPIETLAASMTEGRVANVIARLANGVVCSIEAGTTLPPGSTPGILDRHELIARRGVAADRVVDTQVPQSSIYTFTDRGPQRFTDTDAELFGLEEADVALVRAAYELAREPDRIVALGQQHRRLVGLVETAYEADRTRQRLAVKGGAA